MGRITEENRRILSAAKTYEEAPLDGMNPSGFSRKLSTYIAEKKIPVQYIVDSTGLSKSYVNKLRNLKGINVHPARPVVLNLGLALNLSLNEMDDLLKSARYQELYSRDTDDSVIMWGLMHGLSGSEIRHKLYDMGLGKDILRQD